MLKVEGPENKEIYTGKQNDVVYLPEGGAIQTMDDEVSKRPAPVTKAELMARGKRVFEANCMACHQGSGEGIANVFPPLAKSDFLMADKNRSIQIVSKGLSGSIKVNGKTFNSVMPAQALNNEDIASVLTYVRNSFGNSGDIVTVQDVVAGRASAVQPTPTTTKKPKAKSKGK